MASSIASLFGPTAEELMYAQQESMKQQQQQQLQQNLSMQSSPLAQQFYQSGYNIASGIGGMFGDAPMADPRLAQSIKARKIMSDIGVEDLNDPGKLKMLQNAFSEAGMPEASLYFADRGNAITQQNKENEIAERKAAGAGVPGISDINAFSTQIRKTFEDNLNDQDNIKQARLQGALALRDKDPSSSANQALNSFLTKAVGDSRLTENEVKRVAESGAISKRIANAVSLFVVGTETPKSIGEKIEMLNAMEVILNARYSQKRDMIIGTYRPYGISQDIFDVNVPEISLSQPAQDYLEREKKSRIDGNDTGWGPTGNDDLRLKKDPVPAAKSNRSATMSGGK